MKLQLGLATIMLLAGCTEPERTGVPSGFVDEKVHNQLQERFDKLYAQYNARPEHARLKEVEAELTALKSSDELKQRLLDETAAAVDKHRQSGLQVSLADLVRHCGKHWQPSAIAPVEGQPTAIAIYLYSERLPEMQLLLTGDPNNLDGVIFILSDGSNDWDTPVALAMGILTSVSPWSGTEISEWLVANAEKLERNGAAEPLRKDGFILGFVKVDGKTWLTLKKTNAVEDKTT